MNKKIREKNHNLISIEDYSVKVEIGKKMKDYYKALKMIP